MVDETYTDREMYYNEDSHRLPYIVAIVFLLLVGAVIAFFTTQVKTISPLPEEILRVIFISPMPSDTPAPTATASATPGAKATSTPRPKATATPEPEEEKPSPTAEEEEPTVTPTGETPTATPVPEE